MIPILPGSTVRLTTGLAMGSHLRGVTPDMTGVVLEVDRPHIKVRLTNRFTYWFDPNDLELVSPAVSVLTALRSAATLITTNDLGNDPNAQIVLAALAQQEDIIA
jgi:hypothetical protein